MCNEMDKVNITFTHQSTLIFEKKELCFCRIFHGTIDQDLNCPIVRLWNLQRLSYKPSALAIKLNSSKAIAEKELSLCSW